MTHLRAMGTMPAFTNHPQGLSCWQSGLREFGETGIILPTRGFFFFTPRLYAFEVLACKYQSGLSG